MALETLNGIKCLGQYSIVVMDDLREQFPDKFNASGGMDYAWFEKEIRPKHFVYIRHDMNSISFTLQRGPVKENGVNGCQVDTLIEASLAIIEGLNKQIPHPENHIVMAHLQTALDHLHKRTKDREHRGVEGTDVA